MEQYIPKSVVLAEIENLLDKGKYHDDYDCAFRDGNNAALYALKGRINTLEGKDMDLEKEIDKELDEEWYGEYISHEKFKKSAKYFFELGMQVSNKQQKGE